MKKFFILLIMFLSAFAVKAQDESYRGGNADGHSADSVIAAAQYASILMFSPYLGSIADGHAADSLITFAQGTPALLFSPYLGSIADGYATDSLITFPQYASILMFSPFKGSTGDGYATDGLIVLPQYAYIPMFQPFSGGQADGWTGFPIFNITLPVSLLSFTGEQKDKKHLLHWSTSQEQNTSYFDIEKSPDGRRFTKIGKTNAAGNSSSLRNYNFADASPMEGNNFYRLNMFDTDGSSKFSNIILLKLLGNKATMAIYPNPAAKTLNVLLGGLNDNSTVLATVFDANGKTIQSISLKKTNSSFSFDVDRLPAGMYMLRVIWNNETSVWRFIKQ